VDRTGTVVYDNWLPDYARIAAVLDSLARIP